MKGKSSLFSSKKRPASGDVSFRSGPVEFFDYIERRKDIDPNGYIDIVAHGTSHSIQIKHNGRDIDIGWRELANLIKHNKTLKNKPVRLLSCNTGSDPNGFAQNLANKLGVKVVAPNKVLWCWPNGSHMVASRKIGDLNRPNLKDKGEFVTFAPGGNRK